ncbi:unnamed protein product [Soboliphyme baturini]|uniref:CRAL-TRIO domain-containing protein n=1 Tax=Soboliphyme baturini TaxID=241478 RepID=A0A183IZI9_9BILA|nr:unnamed protein product [Soboliphyme baturini]
MTNNNGSDNEHESAAAQRGDCVDFVEPEDSFTYDDLMNTDLVATTTDDHHIVNEGSNVDFLRRDENFEEELGSPAENALSEDFSGVAKYEVVDLAGDDRAGRPVIVVYAYRLPSNLIFDYEKFLRYLTYTFDRFVDQDYTIIYFHHGLHSFNKPSIRWLIRAYHLLDRKYKKNLKALYLVHPTRFIKFLWTVFQPLISVKFERKIRYVNYLHELRDIVHCDQLVIPKEIEEYVSSLLSVKRAMLRDQLP